MRSRAFGLGLLFVVAVVVVPPPRATLADEAANAARARFLQDADAPALAAALAGTPGGGPYAVADVLLAQMAADPAASPGLPGADGYAALPGVVAALRRLDLDGAMEGARRVGADVSGGIGVWAMALIDVRRGADAEGAARLSSAASAPGTSDGHDDFAFAIFGAALPRDDRLLLAVTARRALLEAAAEGRLDVAVRLARYVASLDREAGPAALCVASRALRRAGRPGEAAALLSGPAATRLRAKADCLALEAAITHWRLGRLEQARAAAGAARSDATSGIARALARARTVPAELATGEPLSHAEGTGRCADLLARWLSLLGEPTRPEVIEARARALDLEVTSLAFARALLRERGFEGLALAGSARAADAALAAGLPMLLYRIVSEGERFVDRPFLVTGHDPDTGLWLLAEPDCRRPDLAEPAVGRKAWCLVAAPPDRAPALRAVDAQAERLGRLLMDVRLEAERGDGAAALARLERQSANFGEIPLYHLYRAWLLYDVFAAERDSTSLLRASEAVVRTAAVTPHLAFEHFVRAQGLWRLGPDAEKREAALVAFRAAQQAVPDSAYFARTLFQVLYDAGDRYRDAMTAMDVWRRVDPFDTVSLYVRGRLRAYLGDTDGARQDLRRALDRRADAEEVALDLAGLELDEGRPEVALQVIEDLVSRWPEAATHEPVQAARRAAEGRLVQAAETVPALRSFLRSPHPETRRRVAFALARFESDEAEGLLRRLLQDEDHAVRVTALRVYMRPRLRRRVETDEALQVRIVALLRQDTSELVRGAAAGLLSLVERPFAVKELAAMVAGPASDADPYARSQAAGALGRHDGRLALTALVEALEDPDLGVRQAAISVLFRKASTYHGFAPDGPSADRIAAVRRWRDWLREQEE